MYYLFIGLEEEEKKGVRSLCQKGRGEERGILILLWVGGARARTLLCSYIGWPF